MSTVSRACDSVNLADLRAQSPVSTIDVRHAPITGGPPQLISGGTITPNRISTEVVTLVFPARKIPMSVTSHLHTPSDSEAKTALKEEFPGWNIICSAEGRWWGQRFPVPRELFNQPNVFDADTAAGLRAKLAEVTR